MVEPKCNIFTCTTFSKTALAGSQLAAYPEGIACERLVASGANGEDFDRCYIFWHGKTSFTKVWLKSKLTVGFASKGRQCGRIRAAASPKSPKVPFTRENYTCRLFQERRGKGRLKIRCY